MGYRERESAFFFSLFFSGTGRPVDTIVHIFFHVISVFFEPEQMHYPSSGRGARHGFGVQRVLLFAGRSGYAIGSGEPSGMSIGWDWVAEFRTCGRRVPRK